MTRKFSPKGEKENVFPNVKSLNWNKDNFGPIYIPKKGKTVDLNKESLPFYKQIIVEYEKNSLQVNGDEILINGKSVTDYTFQQDYYWMMGDNRHNSEDSRFWGFLDREYVLGRAMMVFWSWECDEPIPASTGAFSSIDMLLYNIKNFPDLVRNIRWNRLAKIAN